MLAYHNDPALKKKTLAKIAAHREADRIIQGTYWSEDDGVFRGCAVGCLLEQPGGGHERYETEFGIPVQLAWLEDGIFESLPGEQSRTWPERFMDAIPVGADLSAVWPRYAAWLMIDPKWGIANTTDAEDVRAICQRVADGYMRAIDGNPLGDEDANALAWAARAARDARAAWAAWDARDARAARAARAAWDARDARAAWAARAAWDARDAWAAFVQASADKLIELLAAAVVAK